MTLSNTFNVPGIHFYAMDEYSTLCVSNSYASIHFNFLCRLVIVKTGGSNPSITTTPFSQMDYDVLKSAYDKLASMAKNGGQKMFAPPPEEPPATSRRLNPPANKNSI